MYKDKDRQREANRIAAQRRRNKEKGMTPGMTNSGYDALGMTISDEIKAMLPPVPEVKTGKTFDDLPLDVQHKIDSIGAWCVDKGIEDDRGARIARALHYQEFNQSRYEGTSHA